MRKTFQELSLKQSLLALSLVLVSSVAFADPSEKHQKNCETPEAKSLMGTTGSCRIILAAKKIEKQGVCIGTFMGSLPCAVSYVAVPEGAAMNLTCGTDANAPVINQDMEAESAGYNVATLIRKADGQDVVVNDKNEYSLFTNRMLDVSIMDTTVAGVKVSTATILLSLQSGQVALSNVTCK
jgi:hypothetical protein